MEPTQEQVLTALVNQYATENLQLRQELVRARLTIDALRDTETP